MNSYKEIVDFDWDSGEIYTNGRPMLQFYKDIFMASEGGETPQIQNIGNDGPEISDTETLKYFRDKLRQASKIPASRFEKEQGEGAMLLWLSPTDALEKIANCLEKLKASPVDEAESLYSTKFVVLRDKSILEYYIKRR